GRREVLGGAVRDALADVLQSAGGVRPDRIVAAGMLSSEVGLCAVPHVEAPAGLEELARGAVVRHLPEVAGPPILLIPGIRTPAAPGPDGWAEADVMRGEESETLRARLSPPPSPHPPSPPSVFVWPGSHPKLVALDQSGRITRSYTTLAGEQMVALARHTILSANLPEGWPKELDPEALASGTRLAAGQGLGRLAFLVRIAALAGRWGTDQRAAFWLGAVVADDPRHLARPP